MFLYNMNRFVPQVLVTHESGRAVRHALSPVDDESIVIGQVEFGAHVPGDATPALELQGARWAVLHAAILVIIVLAGGTRPVVVGLGAGTQTLGVTARARVSAGPVAANLWANWRKTQNGNADV